ncbi:hypothetical protein GCM10027610_137320 [Dactylosporangium cerinum]
MSYRPVPKCARNAVAAADRGPARRQARPSRPLSSGFVIRRVQAGVAPRDRRRQDRHAQPAGRELGHHLRRARLERDRGREPGRRARRLEDAADAGAGPQADQRPVAQVGDPDGRAPGPGVTRGDGGVDGLVGQDAQVEVGRWGVVRDDRRVQAPLPQPVDEAVGGVLGQGDLDARVLGVEVGEDRGQVDVVRGHGPDRDPAAGQPGQLGGGAPGTLDGGERGPRVGQHRRAGRGQPDLPAGAVQQVLPELPLQLPDLRAHARLRDPQPGRGAGEARLLGDGDEVRQLVQLHKR